MQLIVVRPCSIQCVPQLNAAGVSKRPTPLPFVRRDILAAEQTGGIPQIGQQPGDFRHAGTWLIQPVDEFAHPEQGFEAGEELVQVVGEGAEIG